MLSVGGVRAVIDTNVLLSGMLWRGTPHRLIEAVRAGTITLITSPVLLAEFDEVIRRPKFHAVVVRSRTNPVRTLGELRRLAEIVEPPPLPAPVSRDSDDDVVLALAAVSRADLVISGDADLLTLGSMPAFPSSILPVPSPASAAEESHATVHPCRAGPHLVFFAADHLGGSGVRPRFREKRMR